MTHSTSRSAQPKSTRRLWALLLCCVGGVAASAPANDHLADAQEITGQSGTVTGSNVDSTAEAGEQTHSGVTSYWPGSSVWYKWTAPSSLPVSMDTLGSTFDTDLAVYTGDSIDTLTTVTYNRNVAQGQSWSRAFFTPTAGTTYKIAVAGAFHIYNFNHAEGTLKLNWGLPPQASASNWSLYE
jgi:uncharacterized protein (DUF2147 family)